MSNKITYGDKTALTGKVTPAKTTAKTQPATEPTKTESVTKKVLDAPKKLFKSLFD